MKHGQAIRFNRGVDRKRRPFAPLASQITGVLSLYKLGIFCLRFQLSILSRAVAFATFLAAWLLSSSARVTYGRPMDF
jgi:hypothetical protein